MYTAGWHSAPKEPMYTAGWYSAPEDVQLQIEVNYVQFLIINLYHIIITYIITYLLFARFNALHDY